MHSVIAILLYLAIQRTEHRLSPNKGVFQDKSRKFGIGSFRLWTCVINSSRSCFCHLFPQLLLSVWLCNWIANSQAAATFSCFYLHFFPGNLPVQTNGYINHLCILIAQNTRFFQRYRLVPYQKMHHVLMFPHAYFLWIKHYEIETYFMVWKYNPV